MKAVVGAFNQEKALVGAFSMIMNLRIELFQALLETSHRRDFFPGPRNPRCCLETVETRTRFPRNFSPEWILFLRSVGRGRRGDGISVRIYQRLRALSLAQHLLTHYTVSPQLLELTDRQQP